MGPDKEQRWLKDTASVCGEDHDVNNFGFLVGLRAPIGVVTRACRLHTFVNVHSVYGSVEPLPWMYRSTTGLYDY